MLHNDYRLHSSFQFIPLYGPKLYLSCETDLYLRKTNDTFKLPCPSSSDIQNVYDLPNAKSCDWFDVDFIPVSHLKVFSPCKLLCRLFQDQGKPVSNPVPVGNQSLSIPVSIITLIVAWAAAAYLIFAVLKQRNRIQKKMS